MKSLIVMIVIGFCLVYSQNAPHVFLHRAIQQDDHRTRMNGSSLGSMIDSIIATKINGHGRGLSLPAHSLRKAPAAQGQIYVPDTVTLYSTSDTSQYTVSYNVIGRFTRGQSKKLVNENWINVEQDSLTYDARGNRISELDERWADGYWIPVDLYTYTYDVNGNKLSELNEQWSDGQLWKSRNTYTYGTNRKIQSEVEEQWLNGMVWTNNRKYSYSYDTSGQTLSELVEQWLHGQWTNEEQFTYAYDAKGNKLFELDEQWSNGQWTNYLKDTYTYDAHGNMLSDWVRYWFNGQWINYEQEAFTCDASGNMLSELVMFWSDGQWINYFQYTYTYNTHGNMLSELMEYWLSGRWSWFLRILHNYDSHWNLVSESSATWSGSSWDPIEETISIDAGNYQYAAQCCSLTISYTLIDTIDVLTVRYTAASTYSLSQNYPNPFNSSTTITVNLPLKGFVSLRLFDMLGRKVATLIDKELDPGIYVRQWNAANMASGMYFYQLQVRPLSGGQAGPYTETKKLVLLR